MRTTEGGTCYEFSMNHALEYFSKAGSLFNRRESFYRGCEEDILSLFKKSWVVAKEITMKLLFWTRDCRGGAGNRSGFRTCANWIARTKDWKWIEANLHLIPEYGRYDDLKVLFGTLVEEQAAEFWADKIKEGDVLAAKWAKRDMIPLQKALGVNEARLRKILSKIRKNHIIEYKMCSNLWNEINYPTVPSIAMARYTNAFERHDRIRFENFKEKLREGREKIHSEVLFPHDCVRTVKYGDPEIADAQFEALPNFIGNPDERIMVICDTSGSMGTVVSGSMQMIDISQGLALYCSAKIPENNLFHKKFIGFSEEGRFVNWNGYKFSETIYDRKIFTGAIGSTRIDKALDLILDTAKMFNLTSNQLPTVLLIVSDMQFHEGVEGSGTEVEKALKKWDEAGYKRPVIVYWNLAGYLGNVAEADTPNTVLVSGFSPSVLKSLFEDVRNLNPYNVMLKTLEKYVINIPKN